MPISQINGVNLYWEVAGEKGEPLILVHGSWVDHHNWDAVVGELSKTFRVITYDRRGHSQSERPSGLNRTENDVFDLISLLEHLRFGPAHIAGNSFGATIALKTATKRPDLFKTLVAHEPPLLGLLMNNAEVQPVLQETNSRIEKVMRLIASGKNEEAAFYFVETVALGPGAWQQFSKENQQAFINNAGTWYEENQDPESYQIDIRGLSQFNRPVLLSNGTQSPPFFSMVLSQLASAIPNAKQITIEGAGHVPQLSHPEKYVEVVKDFCLTSA